MVRRCRGPIIAFVLIIAVVPTEQCDSDSFACGDGQCIPLRSKCDYIQDCKDGSDENDCFTIKCAPPMWFRCGSGRCISSLRVCDGDVDCSDGSDEDSNCTAAKHAPEEEVICSADEFMCINDRICISSTWVCDGEPDCPDGSDETVKCQSKIDCSDGFRCKNNNCIIKEFHCDGMDDCGDNSDEESCSTIFYSPDNCMTDKGYFLCEDKVACIEEKDVCDGFPHCFDNSDEADCLKSQNETKCRSLGCSHSCHLAPHKELVCTCEKGFKLAADGKTCEDIDECLEFGFCHQKCKNLNGSFECSCDNGYILQPDSRTCKASGGDALLLFSSYSQVRGIYLQSDVYFTVASGLNDVIGVSHNGHHVYWTSINHGEVSIIRATESGSDMEVLVNSGLGVPEDLAVDYVTNNIYFTDTRKKHIGVCSENGKVCAVLNNEDIDKPRGIALYPQKGRMYWSDWGNVPLIATSGMDGSDPKALVMKNLKWPNGLALDFSNDRLYWVDAKSRTIETIRLDGTDRQIILKQAVKHPFSIAIFEDMLYWSDWESKEIQKCNKFTGKNHTLVVKEKKKSTIFGVHIYHPVHHPRIENPCKDNRCSDLCVLTPNLTYACACPEESALGSDMHTCRLRTKPLQIAVGGTNKLLLFSPHHLGKQVMTEIKLPDIRKVGCMTYDSLSGSILLNDVKQRKIFRFNIKTEEISVLISSGLGYVTSMSFDSYGNNLYFTDAELKRVDVWSMSSNSLVTVYKTYHGDIPESVVVVPEHGVFFLAVSRTNQSASISRVNMDGTEIIPDIGGIHVLGSKISLTYDKKTQKIYWSHDNVIESMNIDGTGREIIHSITDTPVSMVAQNGSILWVRKSSSNLFSYDMFEDFDVHHHPETVTKLTIEYESHLSLALVGEIESSNIHPCQKVMMNDCSHICLISKNNRHSCHCPLGMHLDTSNRTCLLHASCNEKQFKCRTDDICIANVQRCDGHADCPSGDDEKDCEMYHCKPDQFTCTNGQCIDSWKRCDNEYDCSDHSDEKQCTSNCTENNFQCGSGECIPITWRCDLMEDCKDSSDENGCSNEHCQPKEFACRTGMCIPSTWECDSLPDCPDGSDEHDSCSEPTCSPNELRCNNGRCVSRLLACDGMNDCGDNTDESSCVSAHQELKCSFNEIMCSMSKSKCVPRAARCNGTAECPRGEDEMDCSNCQIEQFQCRNKKCVSDKWVCDKENDCGDESDEDPLLCDHWNPSRESVVVRCHDFHCRSGECIPLHHVCNGVKNCHDGSDEGSSCDTACRNSSCQQMCMPTPVGGRCSCRDGFVLNADGFSCTDIDECAEERCSQLCTNTLGSFRCDCLPDYILKSDRLTCKSVGEPMSYVMAGDDQVRNVSQYFNSLDFILYEPGSQISGLDLDTRRKLLYWSTGIDHRINVMTLDGKEKSFIMGAGQPGKLSLDWITNNIYYIDNFDYGSIKICNMAEKKYVDVIHVERGFIISSLLFNPVNGVLYYSKVRPSSLRRPVSEILSYTASDRNSTLLVGSDVSWVSGFAFDHIRQYLYWADLYNQIIEKVRHDGRERQVVFKMDVHRPESLIFFEDSLYWLTKGMGSIRKCKLYGDYKGSCQAIPIYIHDIKFLSILQEARQPNVTNPCRNQCGDTALCVLSVKGPKCMCEDGSVLSPGKICDASQMTLSNEISARHALENSKEYLGRDRTPSGSSSAVIGILMTALIVCVAFASYLYIKRKRSCVILETMHFQNPSYGLSHVQGSYHPSELSPGEHQYENPSVKLHPDGKFSIAAREKEAEAKSNCRLDLEEYMSDSDLEDRIDMKANLIP
ncbi:UNVERIFIED_CONTAM: hypothetical protein PYX00_000631 [Menopon gallinae]|uniref:EGF-like domain-containing protein n=1 Tax=Menopon gallinae TaxID=328185 RepID=A0AAW2IA35_9NEOP